MVNDELSESDVALLKAQGCNARSTTAEMLPHPAGIVYVDLFFFYRGGFNSQIT